MGETTTQLKDEIEATRQDISRDVDALAYKASPQRVVGERVSRTKSRLRDVKDRVFGKASDGGQRLGDAGSTVSDTASSAMSSTRGAAASVRDRARQAPGRAVEGTRGNPLAAGVIAFGVGWLTASLLPASSKEAEVAGRVGERVKQPVLDQAKQTASEVGQSMKEPASRAAEQVKSTATEGVGSVKQTAQGAAQDVKQSATSSTEEVKSAG